MSDTARDVALSLIAHTNVGKTTLARTLLARDVGEVRDAAHVTQEATAYPMIESVAGDRLVLWDTPGFGDSARLARRLAQHGNPIGWFLSEVWDRFRDRPLWLAQKAVANVRDHADVVLYLVNAVEEPADAGYVAPEQQVLGWIGKPVIVLLNQTGPPRAAALEQAEEERWRALLADQPHVRSVLALDAFARCWPQETVLMQAVVGALDGAARAAAERLADAWIARRIGQFGASMAALARPIGAAARERRVVGAARWRDTLRHLAGRVGIGRADADAATTAGMQALATIVDADVRASTDALIAIHELDGRAAAEVTAQLASDVVTETPASEGKAALVGGVLSGALAGLAADLASGGLTLGAGLIAGGVVGALGGAGLARGYNVVRGATGTTVRWSTSFLDQLVAGALLRYLAVAHHGRGRGPWTDAVVPSFWREAVARAIAARRTAWDARWRARDEGTLHDVEAAVRDLLRTTAADVLAELYPEAARTVQSASVPAPAHAMQSASVPASAHTTLSASAPASVPRDRS